MKKHIILLSTLGILLSSCGTLFTPTKQSIIFTGLPETTLYDNGKKIGQIKEDGETIIKIKKELSKKILVAKKEGYKNQHVILSTTLNPVSIINLTNIIAWAIDLGTGKGFKYDDDIVNIEMEKSE
jgi:hypothetical protein